MACVGDAAVGQGAKRPSRRVRGSGGKARAQRRGGRSDGDGSNDDARDLPRLRRVPPGVLADARRRRPLVAPSRGMVLRVRPGPGRRPVVEFRGIGRSRRDDRGVGPVARRVVRPRDRRSRRHRRLRPGAVLGWRRGRRARLGLGGRFVRRWFAAGRFGGHGRDGARSRASSCIAPWCSGRVRASDGRPAIRLVAGPLGPPARGLGVAPARARAGRHRPRIHGRGARPIGIDGMWQGLKARVGGRPGDVCRKVARGVERFRGVESVGSPRGDSGHDGRGYRRARRARILWGALP